MSLEEADDGAREISPVVFFPPGENQSYALDARPEVIRGEPEEKPVPKDSSVAGSADSSKKEDDPALTQKESPLSGNPVPPAPPALMPIADKASGPPKANES